MLTSADLKQWLHRRLPRLDKALLVLATMERPAQIKELQEIAASAGFRNMRKWNLSQVLGASKGLAIRGKDGWELTDSGKAHLRHIGVSKVSPAALQVANDLRFHLDLVSDDQTRSFLEEAIACHECELFRAAIVMSWLGAMDVLHRHVHKHRLTDFNAEASRVFGKKWKNAMAQDDLGRMGERDFLERLESIGVLGKNAKAQLITSLDLRNGCGHPNSLKVGVNKSAAHIETLLQNVFQRFA